MLDVKNPHFRKLRERMVRSSYINKVKMPQKEREIVKSGFQTMQSQLVLLMKMLGYLKRLGLLPRELANEHENMLNDGSSGT